MADPQHRRLTGVSLEGDVKWGQSGGVLPFGPRDQQNRGFHKGNSNAEIWIQEQDWKAFVNKIEAIDNKAEKSRRQHQREQQARKVQQGQRQYRVSPEIRNLRTARQTLSRAASALDGPRFVDLDHRGKLMTILSDREAFHSFEDVLRVSMDRARFQQQARRASLMMDSMIDAQRKFPAGKGLPSMADNPMKQHRSGPSSLRFHSNSVGPSPMSFNVLVTRDPSRNDIGSLPRDSMPRSDQGFDYGAPGATPMPCPRIPAVK